MSFSGIFSGLAESPFSFNLNGRVGEEDPIDPDDEKRTGASLQLLGYRDADAPDDRGTLIDNVRSFQKDNGLEVDGVMHPGGPTERKLDAALGELAPPPADMPVLPKGDTTDEKIRSLMDDPRYPADPRLRTHVENAFMEAYPGNAAYDAFGRMERPEAAIPPEAVPAFDPTGSLVPRQAARHGTAGHRTPSTPDYTDGADASIPSEDINAARRAPFEAAREKQERTAAWEKALIPDFTGGNQAAFEAATQRLDELRKTDPDAYAQLSDGARAVHDAYEKSREVYAPIKEKSLQLGLGSKEELDARYAKDAFDVAMHVGALRNADHAVAEPLNETLARIGQAKDLLTSGEIDTAKFDKTLEDIRATVPAGYRNSPVYGQIRDATDLAVEIAKQTPLGKIPGKLADIGEVADQASRSGATSPQQLAATALYIVSSDAMAGGARKAVGKAVDAAERNGARIRDKVPNLVKRAGDAAVDWVSDKFGRGAARGATEGGPKG